jgi:hypothetical protein
MDLGLVYTALMICKRVVLAAVDFVVPAYFISYRHDARSAGA